MQIIRNLMLLATLINLTACSSMVRNVIPNSGPSMEKVYDSIGKEKAVPRNNLYTKNVSYKNSQASVVGNQIDADSSLTALRYEVGMAHSTNSANTLRSHVNPDAVSEEFHKLPNPELHLYIYPHLAGTDQVPVPGYYTIFNAYERDHYALPQEMMRG
jgi:conjugative transfer region lipoprotein (TIGR03751 family)